MYTFGNTIHAYTSHSPVTEISLFKIKNSNFKIYLFFINLLKIRYQKKQNKHNLLKFGDLKVRDNGYKGC